MMRVVLSFWAAIGLLMPAGICTCAVASTHDVEASTTQAVSAAEVVTHSSGHSCACHKRSAASRCSAGVSADKPSQTANAIESTHREAPREHTSGCPVLQVVEKVKTSQAPIVLFVASTIAVATVDEDASTVRRLGFLTLSRCDAVSVPRFVSHCSFLI